MRFPSPGLSALASARKDGRALRGPHVTRHGRRRVETRALRGPRVTRHGCRPRSLKLRRTLVQCAIAPAKVGRRAVRLAVVVRQTSVRVIGVTSWLLRLLRRCPRCGWTQGSTGVWWRRAALRRHRARKLREGRRKLCQFELPPLAQFPQRKSGRRLDRRLRLPLVRWPAAATGLPPRTSASARPRPFFGRCAPLRARLRAVQFPPFPQAYSRR